MDTTFKNTRTIVAIVLLTVISLTCAVAFVYFGIFVGLPALIEGYRPHEPDELNGLVGFIGLIMIAGSLIALGIAVGSAFIVMRLFRRLTKDTHK